MTALARCLPVLVLAALSLLACDAIERGAGLGKGPGATGDDGGAVDPAPAGGGTAGSPPGGSSDPPVQGGPGAEEPAEPGGFKLAISPLLEQAGCIECHHGGRPVDLSRYPFMAGSKAETADKLAHALGSTMPPSPRAKVDASLIARIEQWRNEGMKP